MTPTRASREDATIEAPASAPVREIVSLISQLVGAPPDGVATVDGRPVDTMSPLAGSLLREGAILTVDEAGAAAPAGGGAAVGDAAAAGDGREPPPASCLELMVVGGPAAGYVHRLAMGTTALGRGATSSLRLDDPDVSRDHAAIIMQIDNVSVADKGSTNGTYLDGERVGRNPMAVRVGARLRIGESTLLLAMPGDAPVAIGAGVDGRLSFNRPPRLDAPDPNAARISVPFPAEPVERPAARMPLIATLAPLAAGVVLAAVMRRPEYLLFTVLSPIMMAGQWLSDRVGHRRLRRAEQATYATALARARQTLAAALSVEVAERHRRSPDPASLVKIAQAPGVRLWERRRGDLDFLTVRLGLGNLPAEVVITGAAPSTAAELVVADIPVTVNLGSVGVLGIAGPPVRTAAIARSIIGQLAVLHSPRDLALVLLTEPARAESWHWMRWLPHIRPDGEHACQALLGLDSDSLANRVGELAAIVESRRDAATTAGDKRGNAIVVIVDGSRSLRRTASLASVLDLGPDVGVYAICLDEEETALPEECRAVALVTGDMATRVALRLAASPSSVEAVADGVSIGWADRVSRALAALRDDAPRSGADALPEAVRWLDIAGLSDDMTSDLMTRWRRRGTGTTRATVGVGSDGMFAIDLARDGPHALVAGTTGSGKSELLQTLVASLAVANRPDELTFVLIDYKGGAAFGACAALPHTVGVVTDLDGGLVERALVSLGAELRRREALLAAVSAPNIDAFRETGATLARLVIMVDEFASLADELPEFVGGLVGIAQRGRSLGVHLVLATQRPEGVISADIRANTNLRISLAVMRDSESRDVIEAPDAARISRTTPGRGYVRTGHGELRAFQSGRVGGDAQAGTDTAHIDVRLSPFRSLCLPGPPPITTQVARDATKTDLDLIVAACREAAIRLEIEPAASPWLAPLPIVVPCEAAASAAPDPPLVATFGMHDVPARQSRASYVFNLESTGHLVVAGSARSGRTTALRTLAGALARSTTVADLHMYAVDCAGGSLTALTALPHCGAVISSAEADRARRLLSLLTSSLTERQRVLAAGGFGSLAEQRAGSGAPLPHLLLLIDGWEAFTSTFEDVDAGAIVDAANRLLREGTAVGIHIVTSADRAGLIGRLASTVENRLVLRLADRTDYSLIGLPPRSLPAVLPAGRGFIVDGLVETQLCLLSPDPSGPGQLAALAEIAEAATRRAAPVPRSQWPRRIDPLPDHIKLSDIEGPRPPVGSGTASVVIGVGGDELDAVTVDLFNAGPGFLIAGPPRSGRSTALTTAGAGLRAAGWRVIALLPRPSAVADHADHAFAPTDDGFEALLADLDGPAAILVDDAEFVVDSPAAAVLDRLMRTARDAGHVVVIAGTTDDLAVGFRGFVVDARRARSGLLLNPRGPFDGEVLGVRLPRGSVDIDGRGTLPGRGLLVVRGAVIPVHIATPGHTTPTARAQPQTVTAMVPTTAPACETFTVTTPSTAPV